MLRGITYIHMERFSLVTLFTRRWPIILGLTLLVFVAAWLADRRQDPLFYGSQTVTVQPIRVYPETEQLILQPAYTQDLQIALATSQNWLADPYYVRRTFERAGVQRPELSLREYARVFQPFSAVAGASTYQVQFVGTSEQEVRSVFQALQVVMEEANQAHQVEGGDLRILLTFADATVTSQGSGLPIVPLAGLLAGLLFAMLVAAVYDRSARA
jgi:hypothetical protein